MLLIPPPPQPIRDFDAWMAAHGIVPLLWYLLAVKLAAWGILVRQRRPGESSPRRSLRWVLLGAALVWLSLLGGQYLTAEWRLFWFVVAGMFAGLTATWFVAACVRTYGLSPGRDGAPPLDEEIGGTAYAGEERRERERRKDWPPRIGA